MVKKSFSVGDFKATLVRIGEFSLDAGMVYGGIPKTLWGRVDSVDDLNRVRLGINFVFLDDGNRRILIDSGAGSLNKYDTKLIEIWNLKTEEPDDVLGLDENDIDVVILTHLHFDHAGGLTRQENGEYVPIFKKAIHYIHQDEYKAALNPTLFDRFSYFDRDFKPLVKNNLVRFIKGNGSVIDKYLSFTLTKGHTLGHIIVKFTSQSQTLIHPGDIILTKNHVPLAWVSGIDLCKLDTLHAREKLYEEVVKIDHIMVFPHDRNLSLGKIAIDKKGKFVFKEPS